MDRTYDPGHEDFDGTWPFFTPLLQLAVDVRPDAETVEIEFIARDEPLSDRRLHIEPSPIIHVGGWNC
ncbi:MAG: hypothetical protein M3P30_00525 [Chloroflexota bacterium]|nr:hypothetical protein [Chloroflexota bacterium]